MSTKSESVGDSFYRQIYILSAVAAITVMFAGFARSYFLIKVYDGAALTPLLHLHGFVMTLWFVLFFLQSFLIKSNHVSLHRRIGVLGAGVAAAVIVVGPATAIASARLHGEPSFVIVPLFDLLGFAILAGTGLLMRQRKEFHKRLMTLAALGILTAAIVRIPLTFIQKAGVPFAFGLDDALILTVVAFDTIKNRRLHPAYGWGVLLLVVLQVSRFLLIDTSQWASIANWLVH